MIGKLKGANQDFQGHREFCKGYSLGSHGVNMVAYINACSNLRVKNTPTKEKQQSLKFEYDILLHVGSQNYLKGKDQ